MVVKLLTENYLQFLSLKGDCRGSSESTLVKMPHCWKSHATAQLVFNTFVTKSVGSICSSTENSLIITVLKVKSV